MAVCNMTMSLEATSMSAAAKFFPFTALPGELRREIYCQYLGCWDAVIEYDRKSARFTLGGQPEHNLMLIDRTTHSECRALVPQSFSGHLILRDTKIRRDRGFGYVSSFDEIVSICPFWLLSRVTVLSIDQGTTGMLMSLPWPSLGSLREIHLESNSLPVGYYYPCGIAPGARRSQWQHILDGVYDTWCLNGYNKWSQVPKPVATGEVRVLTYRKGAVKSISLKIWVEHKPDRAEVVCRTVEPLR